MPESLSRLNMRGECRWSRTGSTSALLWRHVRLSHARRAATADAQLCRRRAGAALPGRRRPREPGRLSHHHHRLGRYLGDCGCPPAHCDGPATGVRQRHTAFHGGRRFWRRARRAVGQDARPSARPCHGPDLGQRHRDPGAGPHQWPPARLRRGRHDACYSRMDSCRAPASSTRPGGRRSLPSASQSPSRSTSVPSTWRSTCSCSRPRPSARYWRCASLRSTGDACTSRRRSLANRAEQLQVESEKSERLLLNILPQSIATRLRNGEETIADEYGQVSVLFADIVGFTPLSARLQARDVVSLLSGTVLCLRRPGG